MSNIGIVVTVIVFSSKILAVAILILHNVVVCGIAVSFVYLPSFVIIIFMIVITTNSITTVITLVIAFVIVVIMIKWLLLLFLCLYYHYYCYS